MSRWVKWYKRLIIPYTDEIHFLTPKISGSGNISHCQQQSYSGLHFQGGRLNKVFFTEARGPTLSLWNIIFGRKSTSFKYLLLTNGTTFTYLVKTTAGADLGGGCRGCAPPPPPWDDLRFSNTTGILQKNYVVYWCWSRARDECTPPKKNPGSAPALHPL